MVYAFDPARLEMERESWQVRRPALARLEVVLPECGRGDVKGDMDGLIEVVDDGEIRHGFVCTLG